MPDFESIMVGKGVTKRFGGMTAVDHVDFELREGEILGLIGPNGAGKTTLFNCISGFLTADEGTITLNGVKIYASGDTSKTKQMETFAALELDYALFPGDGLFNMGLDEAAECARIIGAKHNIIIHLKPGESVRKKAEKWNAPNKLIIEPGQEIEL